MVAFTRRFQQVALAGGLLCSIAGGTVIWKDAVKGKELSINVPNKLEDKVFLVTGANSGIGREITLDLAKRQAKVFMLCRDMNKCEEVRKEIVLSTKNKYVYCRHCDLASQKSIRQFVEEFKKTQNRVDGLVNNAGILKAPRALSPEGVEIHLATNHQGHFLLTNLLLDLLKSSAPSRIVFLMNMDYRKASLVANLTDLNLEKNFNKTQAFRQSQLANMLLVLELSDRLQGTGVTCNAAYPGVVGGTGIKRHMGVEKSILGKIFSKPLLWVAAKPPQKGAQTPLFALLEPNLNGVTGRLFSNMEERPVEGEASDKVLAKKLFLIDEYWTGLKSKEEIVIS